MSLGETLGRISKDYGAAKVEPFGKHPVARYIRETGASEVQEALRDTNPDLRVEGSAGAGNWAAVPWVGVFDPLVTDSATRGYYVVYLFHATEPTVHLSLNQGTTSTREEFGPKTRQVLADRAGFMRRRLAEFANLLPADTIELGSQARLPGDYAAGHALGLTYRLDQLPPEDVLRADLQTAIRAYRALTFPGGLGLTPEGDDSLDDDLGTASLVERRQYRLHRRIERNPYCRSSSQETSWDALPGLRARFLRAIWPDRTGLH